MINGEEYEAYGNHFLLQHPFKMAVRIHRNNTDEENERLKEKWLEHIAEGGVLVSPFISPKEKHIRKCANEMGGKIILIQNEPFPEKYKPALSDFNLCSQGKLLIIAPVKTMGSHLNYEICTKMNELAEKIADE